MDLCEELRAEVILARHAGREESADNLYAIANHVETVESKLAEMTRAVYAGEHGDYWVWQGDEFDHPESLTCRVLMRADEVREFVAAKALVETLPKCWTVSPPWSPDGKLRQARPVVPPMTLWEVRKNWETLFTIEIQCIDLLGGEWLGRRWNSGLCHIDRSADSPEAAAMLRERGE